MSGLDLHGSVQRVGIQLFQATSMNSINVKRFGVQVSTSGLIRQVAKRVVRNLLLGVAGSGAEVRNFVHVLPKSIEGNVIVELGELGLPPGDGLGIEEVGEYGITWPNLTNEIFGSVGSSLEENIVRNTVIISSIFTSGSLGNTDIENRNEVHVLTSEIRDKVGQSIKLSGSIVIGEILIVIKIINIGPLGIQGNT